jgi:phytoene desaturase
MRTAPLVVSNADAGHTYDRLLRNHKKKRWTPAKLKSRRWSMGLFVWYFGTKGTAQMWKDVGHHTILAGPRYEGLLQDIFIKGHLADDMSLYLHRPRSPIRAWPRRGMIPSMPCPPSRILATTTRWTGRRKTERYRAKVAAVLEHTIPGFQKHLSASLTFTPEDFRTRYLSPNGSGFSIEPRILQSAWFRPHNVSEEAKGLYLVGAGTHPGAGVPGVVASSKVLDRMVPDAPLPRAYALPLAAE